MIRFCRNFFLSNQKSKKQKTKQNSFSFFLSLVFFRQIFEKKAAVEARNPGLERERERDREREREKEIEEGLKENALEIDKEREKEIKRQRERETEK